MRFSIAAFSTFFLSQVSTKVAQAVGTCAPEPLEFSDTISVTVEKVGSVPAVDTDPYSYNMAVMDNFDDETIFFLDQKNGKIFSFNSASYDTNKIFDVETSSIPEGLDFTGAYIGAAQTYRVKAMTQGSSFDEVIVVFTSKTLPKDWSEPDAKLPPPEAWGQWFCSEEKKTWVADIYRPGVLPDCLDMSAGVQTFTAYDVFYKFKMIDGELQEPKPFFVSESAVLPGHLGSGIVTVEDGKKILWSTGDCTIFGVDGAYAPQLDFETCGKILLIDTRSEGEFSIVAKGVRNSQQMRIITQDKESRRLSPRQGKGSPKSRRVPSRNLKKSKGGKKGDLLAFMDIGGVTAEEVNAAPLEDILDEDEIENFGWGRNIYDGKAREGTFYVNAGNGGVLGSEPSCKTNAPIPEAGFIQPWIQFGRTATDFFYAISSLAVPTAGTDKLKLLWSEFNTGNILATDQTFVEGAPPVTAYKIKIFDEDGNYLENGLNDLVAKELDDVSFTTRGDPRLFHFFDGHAGVFIERTGAIYKITEGTL